MTNEKIALEIFNEMMKHQPGVYSQRKLGAKTSGMYAIRMVVDAIKKITIRKDELALEVAKWEDITEKLKKI